MGTKLKKASRYVRELCVPQMFQQFNLLKIKNLSRIRKS